MEAGFYYKNQLSEIPSYAEEISAEIVWIGKYNETFKFYTVPTWEKFVNFLGVRFFPIGHLAYNLLGLSTQVPGRGQYLLEKEIPEITYTRFCAVYKVANDPQIFDLFTPLEYMFVESLARYDNIVYDGYFKTQVSLVEGIFKRMDECKVSKEKIVSQSVKERPELLKVLNKKQRLLILNEK